MCFVFFFFFCLDKGGLLRCNKSEVKDWEKFTLIFTSEGPTRNLTITANNKQFLCAENGGGGNVVCNRKTAGDWEGFRLNNLDYVAPVPMAFPGGYHPQQYGGAAYPYSQFGAPAPYGAGPPAHYGGSAPYAAGPPYGGAGPLGQYGAPAPYAPAHYGAGPYGAPAQFVDGGASHPAYSAPLPASYAAAAPTAAPPAAAPPALPPKPSRGSARGSSSSLVVATKAPQEFIELDPATSAETQAAHQHIGEFCTLMQSLDNFLSEKLNPNSQGKTLKGTLAKLTSSAKLSRKQVVLNRDEKNSTLQLQREMLEGFNMFLFDWGRFSKTLSERDFNRVALLLGKLIENLKEFRGVIDKSDTMKESLDKLLEKFSAVNIKFEQTINYSNSGSSNADFSNQETIVDHSETVLNVESEDN
jgi:hypothetical protein